MFPDPISRTSSDLPARLAMLAAGLAATAAAAGLLVPHLYRDSEPWIRQAHAADLVTLLVVAPILALASWPSRRRLAAARMAAMAATGYLAYNYAIFGFAVAINPMTPLHIAVLGLAGWSLVLSIRDATGDPALVGLAPHLPRRSTAAYLLAVAGLFGLMWLGQIAQAIVSGSGPEEVARLGLVTNPVYTLDLAFALPLFVVTAMLLVQRRPHSRAIGMAVLGWSALTGLGIVAIFAFDAVAGAAVPVPVAVVIGLITVAALMLLAIGLRASPARVPTAAPASR